MKLIFAVQSLDRQHQARDAGAQRAQQYRGAGRRR